MTLFRRILSVMRGLFFRNRTERDLDSELQSFVDLSAAEKEREGIEPAEARRLAILELGGIEQAKERVRTHRHGALLEQIAQDVRYALRTFAKSPVFVLIVVATLGLGIGANTAIFSVMNAVMLKSLPVHEPERLVEIRMGPEHDSFSNPLWEQIRDQREIFDGAMAYSIRRDNLTSGGETHFVSGLQVSGSYFDVLGVKPVIGRTFTEADDRRGCGRDGLVAVLSYGFWQSHYGGATDIVGKPITIERRTFTIIGVSPSSFSGVRVGESFDIATPLCSATGNLDNSRVFWLWVVGRLKHGTGANEAEIRLRGVQTAMREATTPADAPRDFTKLYLKEPLQLFPAATGSSYRREEFRPALMVLITIAGIVLLITCGNIASLLLARATARVREIAVRVSIGASRFRLIRQLLIESILLSVSGAALGLLLAQAGSRLLVYGLSTASTKLFLDVSIDWRVLAFTIATGLITGLLFGLAPALRATRWSPAETLREISATATASRRRIEGGRWLVSFQMGLSLLLVFGAALFLHSYHRLTTGFDTHEVLLIETGVSAADNFGVSGSIPHEEGDQVPPYSQVLQAVRAVRGVQTAAYSFTVPMAGSSFHTRVQADGYQPQSDEDSEVPYNEISPDYFKTLGTVLIAGRDFDAHDGSDSPIAIVNQAFARKFISNGDPVGTVIRVIDKGKWIPTEIVGLVQDAKYDDLREDAPPTIYQVANSRISPGWLISVKTFGPVTAFVPQIVKAIATGNKDIPVTVRTWQSQIDDELVQERLIATLSAFFGILALIIAAIGLAGLISYSVARRRAEIGIRAALGATSGSLVRLVMHDVIKMTIGGLILGSLFGLAGSRFIAAMLYGIKPDDVPTLAAAASVLALVALVAGYIPARRAARIDPMHCLRSQ